MEWRWKKLQSAFIKKCVRNNKVRSRVCFKMVSSVMVIEEFGNITLRRKLSSFESYGKIVNLRSERSLIEGGTITEQAFQAY